MRTVFYKVKTKGLPQNMRIALVSDLHAADPHGVICALRNISPNYILLAGDILESLDGSKDSKNRRAVELLSACADIAPTFYSTGNHEDGGTNSGTRNWNKALEKDRKYTAENIGM